MLKVIVADDEEKICQLIIKLIDWDALKMEVLCVTSNGIETLENIERYDPDIVITDIRMPGIDGLELIKKTQEQGLRAEFVIISGYRHFEYAQKAIRYGVGDYLLKPIKKTELNQTLRKLGDKCHAKDQRITYEEKLNEAMKSDAGRLRATYVLSLLNNLETNVSNLPLEEANHLYHYQFQNGLFQIILIKLDQILIDSGNTQFIINKIQNLLNELLENNCYEKELYFEKGSFYLLLNYSEKNQKQIRKQLKTLLNEMLIMESIFSGMLVTIGVGECSPFLSGLPLSLESARFRVEQRLMEGCGKLISDGFPDAVQSMDSEFFSNLNEKMNEALATYDIETLRMVLKEFNSVIKSRQNITGHEMIQSAKEVCSMYFFSMKQQMLPLENGVLFVEDFVSKAWDCPNLDELLGVLENKLLSSYQRAVESRMQENDRPIRLAKKYIKEHFMEQISLEDVSSTVGFSPTYFSSLFKKETGFTFLEYLSGVRIEEAKRLLRKTNKNVNEICREVGYSDVKYFTKFFIKNTGLKPTEFRKIYA